MHRIRLIVYRDPTPCNQTGTGDKWYPLIWGACSPIITHSKWGYRFRELVVRKEAHVSELMRESGPAAQEMTRRYPLLAVLLALAGGMIGDRPGVIPWSAWLAIGMAALGIGWKLRRRRNSPGPTAVVLLMAIASGGAAWHHAQWNFYRADEISQWATIDGTPVCVDLLAMTGPRWVPPKARDPLRSLPPQERTELLVRALAIRDGRRWRTASGNSRLHVDGRLVEVTAGDVIRVYGKLQSIEPPSNPGENDFSEYARGHRRLCSLTAEAPACVTRLRQGGRWWWRTWLSRLRARCEARIERHIVGPRGGLALAVLLGARERLDDQLTEAFFLTGTVHLLAISGMNVGILAYGCWMATRLHWLDRRQTLWATSVLIVVYAALTDAEPPVMRAAVFVVILAWGRGVGRAGQDWNTLAAAGTVVILMNPATLFQLGTQLSFLAVTVLARLGAGRATSHPSDPLDRLIDMSRSWPERWARSVGKAMWQMTTMSVAVWLLTTPLVWHQFQLISPGALPLNLLVWIPIAVAMYSGFVVLTLGDLVPFLAWICGWLCDASLAVVVGCIRGVLGCPGNHVWLPGPPGWWVVVFYLGAAWVAWRPFQRKWITAALVIGWFALGWLFSPSGLHRWWRVREPHVHCTFLAVGHGECVVIELPGGRTLLYDAGRLGAPDAAVRSIASFLWSRGITHLDSIVISHADADHFNAVPGLLKRFTVSSCLVSPAMFGHADPALKVLRDSLQAAGVPVHEIKRGHELGSGATGLCVLHPLQVSPGGHDNVNSLVLRVDHAGRRILLTGDLEGSGMQQLLRSPPCLCDILQAPHHGSPRSSSREFASWVRPTWVVICGDRRHPLDALQPTYADVHAGLLHTARDGAIEVTLRRDGDYQIRTWRQKR